MKVTTLLFDADGTLLDFGKAEESAFRETLKIIGCERNFEKNLKLYIEINIRLWSLFEKGEINLKELRTLRFSELLDELGISRPGKTKTGRSVTPQFLSDTYLDNLAEGGFLIDNALEIIRELHSRQKYTMAVITNGLKDVQYRRLKKAGIHDYFEKIFISEEIGVQKPEKDFFDRSLKLLGNTIKDDCLIIGDTYSSDIMGGINSGIKTCWYNPKKNPLNGNPEPDYEITDLRELLFLLE